MLEPQLSCSSLLAASRRVAVTWRCCRRRTSVAKPPQQPLQPRRIACAQPPRASGCGDARLQTPLPPHRPPILAAWTSTSARWSRCCLRRRGRRCGRSGAPRVRKVPCTRCLSTPSVPTATAGTSPTWCLWCLCIKRVSWPPGACWLTARWRCSAAAPLGRTPGETSRRRPPATSSAALRKRARWQQTLALRLTAPGPARLFTWLVSWSACPHSAGTSPAPCTCASTSPPTRSQALGRCSSSRRMCWPRCVRGAAQRGTSPPAASCPPACPSSGPSTTCATSMLLSGTRCSTQLAAERRCRGTSRRIHPGWRPSWTCLPSAST